MPNISHSHYQLFFRFLVPYSTLLVVTFALGVFFQIHTRGLLEEEIIEKNTLILEGVRDLIDQGLDQIDGAVEQIRLNRSITKLKYVADPLSQNKVMLVVETMNQLFSFGLSNPLIVDYYILFPKEDLVLGAGKAYKMEGFFENVLTPADRDKGGRLPDEILQPNRKKPFYFPGTEVLLDGSPRRVVGYIDILERYGSPAVYILFLLDERYLISLLGRVDLSDGGYIYIHDGTRIITGKGRFSDRDVAPSPAVFNTETGMLKGRAHREEKMIVTELESKKAPWQFVAVRPANIILRKVVVFRTLTLLVVTAAIFVDIIIAIGLARSSSKHVIGILDFINSNLGIDVSRTADAYTGIRDALGILIRENKEMQTGKIIRKSLLEKAFAKRLFLGEFQTDDEAMAFAKDAGISLGSRYYSVCFIIKAADDSRNRIRNNILPRTKDSSFDHHSAITFLGDYFGGPVVYHSMESGGLAMLCGSDGNTKEDTRPFQRLHEHFADHHNIAVHIYVGNPYQELSSIYKSYEEASIARDYLEFQWRDNDDKRVVRFSDLDINRIWFNFPGEMETRLFHYLLAGDVDGIGPTLDRLYEENIMKRRLSPSVQRLFLEALLSPVMRSIGQMREPFAGVLERIEGITHMLHVRCDHETAYDEIRRLYGQVANRIAAQRNRHSLSLMEDVERYIEENFGDPGLSLTSLGDRFGVSSSSLSRLFRLQLGKNFYTYLESVRMAQARKLLSTTHMSIAEIVDRTGYGSLNSFAKAFKRANGMSASMFRKTKQTAS